ncbi:MAG TPA: S46 family peptidase [Ignavibacteriaceae bacterium]|nr:S46 family peptidase [Ignavibacteriaceae bacterium]
MKFQLTNYYSYILKSLSIFIISLVFYGSTPPDEGMYPLSEIAGIDLKKAGLKIEVNELYNPNGVSLIDALVNTGGCTGSFVSDEGLILTNHHCAFDYIRKASTIENNHLENGFLAEDRSKEIPAEGLVCKITESYEDVSDIILKAASEATDISERTKVIRDKSRELIKQAEKDNPGIKAEVSEMFIGKTYILFKYRTLKDVRLVYAPPRMIGEYGGETDNWVWPRHTGDFTFLRAYVAPDGSTAEYSENNVPFKPKKFLKVNPNGVEENDFIFLLGYPGRTFRHQPSYYTEFHEKYQLPYIADLYRWLIDKLNEAGSNNPELALKLSSRIKSYANVEKNYRGKILGIRRLSLVEKRRSEEAELQKFIDSDPELKKEFGNVLPDIENIYKEILGVGRYPLFYGQLARTSYFRLVDFLNEYQKEMAKPEDERAGMFSPSNLSSTLENVKESFSTLDKNIEILTLSKIIGDAVKFDEMKDFEPFNKFLSEKNPTAAVEDFIKNMIGKTAITGYEDYQSLLENTPEEIEKLNDPLIQFVAAMKEADKPKQKEADVRNGKLNILLAKLLDVKRLRQTKTFIPDANSTLRFTFGYIKGYSPADATYYSPITTLSGLIEKSYLGGDFQIPMKLKEAYEKKDYGRFRNKKLDDVPVAILYNSDTSGGNSGSPILNAYGELIGVNYDRAYEATINDYAWSEDYSRSIGVDIRFILWFTQKIGGADYLLKELNVEL